jgi:hypothetical protein
MYGFQGRRKGENSICTNMLFLLQLVAVLHIHYFYEYLYDLYDLYGLYTNEWYDVLCRLAR